MNDETPFPRTLSEARVADAGARPWPRRDAIAGRFVVVEPLDPARHGAALWDAARRDDPARWRYLPYGPFAEVRTFEAHLAAQAASRDPLFFALAVEGRAAGVASYLEIAPEHAGIEIGHIWFGPDLARTAAATEAMRLMIGHALDDLGYRRMQWKCDALNAASRAAARRLGFLYEGTLHAHRLVKGRNRDTAYYAILAEEWPSARGLIDGWLDAAAGSGRPSGSLSAAMAGRVVPPRG
ncbi:MAG: GNAT family N-acetyltransferase [Paracoccaceae bacterium]